VLDHVQRRRFLVEPAREHPVPSLVRPLNVDLHESAGELLFLPRRRRLARAQAHEQILPSRRLAGVERNRLYDSIALVEDAEHCNALRHGRHAALPGRRDGHVGWGGRLRILLLTAAASSKRQREQQRCGGERPHAYSGIQGS
jgi:hypothetical protein